MSRPTDFITPDQASSLPALFQERVRRTPSTSAYRRFDTNGQCCNDVTWQEVQSLAGRWQAALRREGLQPGERVAVMLHNSLEWVAFDLAALGLGLVTVPLFVNDRPENFAYIIETSAARLLLIEGVEHWLRIKEVHQRLATLKRIVSLTTACEIDCDVRLVSLAEWLPETASDYTVIDLRPDDLATIVYTSGTTGHPKGVMLSHANILTNAFAGVSVIQIYPDDLFLSFLPLSHALERTVGYYLPIMTGSCVAHVRSLEKLAEDMTIVRPTVIVAVPRIFERVHQRISSRLAEAPPWKRRLFALTVTLGWRRFLITQGRAGWSPALLLWPLLDRLVARPVRQALGGRLRLAISGGAPLNPQIARVFIALGVKILQGYGLTETSPVVAVNMMADNRPETVGRPLPSVEVKLAADGELLVKGPNLMAGYWQDQAATAAAIDREGWLHTGDQARIDDDGHIAITGRLKEIIVLANGEKIPPTDMESEIAADPLFEQVMIAGEGKPYLAALVVLNAANWASVAKSLQLDPTRDETLGDPRVEPLLLKRIAARLHAFPGYAQVRRVRASLAPWTVDDGLLTATLKLRRRQMLKRFAAEIAALYQGH